MKINPFYKSNLSRALSGLLFLGIIAIFSTSCSNSESETADSHDHGDHDHEHIDPSAISWPELSELDEYTHKIIAMDQQGDRMKILNEIKNFKSTINTFLESEIPENVKNREQVEVLIADMETLLPAMYFNTGAPNAENTIKAMMAGGNIVEKLMEVSGVPHVHKAVDHESHDGHDHDDHEGHDH